MVANVPLWVTCAVLSNVIGLAFALTALARIGGWDPLSALCCCWKKKKEGAEIGAIAHFRSPSNGGDKGLHANIAGEAGSYGNDAVETLEGGRSSTMATTTNASGLSSSFLAARARAASGLTRDDADAGRSQEFHGGVIGQPWQRGCGCKVRKGEEEEREGKKAIG